MNSNIILIYIHLRLSETFDSIDEQGGWFRRKNYPFLEDFLQLSSVREKSPFRKLCNVEMNSLLGSLSKSHQWSELFTND